MVAYITCMSTNIYTHIAIHTFMHTIYVHATHNTYVIHAHVNAHTNTHTHTHTHTHIHTHTHAHIHTTHSQIPSIEIFDIGNLDTSGISNAAQIG